MAKNWTPSVWGRRFTRSSEWRLSLQGLELILSVDGRDHILNVEDEAAYRLQAGTFWTDFTARPTGGPEIRVDGLPNRQGTELARAIELALVDKRLREDAEFVAREHRAVLGWLRQARAQEKDAQSAHRWFTHDLQADLTAKRPSVHLEGMRQRLAKPGVVTRLGPDAADIERDLKLWKNDWPAYWDRFNRQHVERELIECKDLFDRVESKPLTEEQARAVVCFDNRVQVVASAGSGKTSTMVAKAAYAIHRHLVAPDRIVLLAFNKQAAIELRERASLAFERLGMEGVTVEASTFHALGLGIIGKATGKKPRIPDWATDTGSGLRKLNELIDGLKDRDPTFRAQWDLFRFVFKRDLPAFGVPEPSDVYDDQGKGALVTANGERVKSLEEAMIADWLFLNGVEYRYERAYEHPTADETHGQYHPDFYYPAVGLYHEHFALNANGEAPAHFDDPKKYVEGTVWKRDLHQRMGTDLFETTSHELRNLQNAFKRLEVELTSRGIVLDPNPDRRIPKGGLPPMDASELAALVRTFLSHAKSNGLSIAAIRQRLEGMPDSTFKPRHRMFLDLAEPILQAWDDALAAEDGIDFEDMLNLAAEHLESDRFEAPYELVMADEFQDASRARARLCRALVQKPHRYFFAVGDDWQSINRFAGADVSVMTGFRNWFGHGQVLKLEQTFRCPQTLCDMSSAFVSKNPAQIAKRVRSVASQVGPVLQAFQVDHRDKLTDAIDRFVMQLAEGVRNGTTPPGRNGKVSVYVLGRYNADKQHVPDRPSRFNRYVDVSFLSIHRSKGSEADYVILPEMLTVPRRRSFPSTRADDPVLTLAMPDGDDYPLGEERRLFYVALTRARRGVAMFTARGYCSSFLRELEDDGAVVITDTDGKAIQEVSCPSCKQGVLVMRTGPYGEFRSCSNFPTCCYKPEKRRPSPPSTAEKSRALARPVAQPRAVATARSITPSRPALTASKERPASFLGKVNSFLEDVNHHVARASAMQSATSELSRLLDAERVVIEKAFELAQLRLQQERDFAVRGPEYRARFEESYAELLSKLGDSVPKPDVLALERHPLPDFNRVGSHHNPDIQRAIALKVQGLRDDREAFLSGVHAQLARDPTLLAQFQTSLGELNGDHYWTALDPHVSLKRRA